MVDLAYDIAADRVAGENSALNARWKIIDGVGGGIGFDVTSLVEKGFHGFGTVSPGVRGGFFPLRVSLLRADDIADAERKAVILKIDGEQSRQRRQQSYKEKAANLKARHLARRRRKRRRRKS